MDKQDLINFEEEIKNLFLDKQIRSPIHLSGGNEEELIEIFKEIRSEDWVLSTHRSHLHALLKGVPPEFVKAEILTDRSMHLNFKEYNFLTSAIVGGIAPIAVGIAIGIKMKSEDRRVWSFIGDMGATMGIVHESIKYSKNFNLPACFCIEDNGLSSSTPTREVWGISEEKLPPVGVLETLATWPSGKVIRYRYERRYPHCGAGQFVRF